VIAMSEMGVIAISEMGVIAISEMGVVRAAGVQHCLSRKVERGQKGSGEGRAGRGTG